MPNVDFFQFFRWVLATVATIYATVITLQSLYGWYVYLASGDKYVALVRRYLIVHGLRLRFSTFWGDVIVSALLCVVFFILWAAHVTLRQTGDALSDAHRAQHSTLHLRH